MNEYPGLVLKLREGYQVTIGPEITLTVEKIKSNYEVKIRIEAPQEIHILWDKFIGNRKVPRIPET